MPLFVCSVCSCVDNTALTNFVIDHYIDNRPALCSACDPRIGTWHNRFTQRVYDPSSDIVLNPFDIVRNPQKKDITR